MNTDRPSAADLTGGEISSEEKTSSPNVPEEEKGLGVALSGGGVRATLFSLGALMYLVDSGYSRDVTDISSVSGGSITNAFIAQHIDFKTAHEDPASFDDVAKRLVRILTEKGLLSARFFVLGFAVAVALCGAVLWWFSSRVSSAWWVTTLLTIGVIVGLGTLLLLRGHLLSWSLGRLLFTAKNGGAARLGATNTGVRHVFCATDLNAASPFYFTNLLGGLMGNSKWGMWKAETVPLADAVRSSAAFPGAFPPKRLKLEPKDQAESIMAAQQRSMREPPPEAVFLADGGVWNNLATAWFDDAVGVMMALDPTTIRTWWPANTRRLLVINASAPLERIKNFWLLTVPFVAEVAGFFRFINVLYLSTIVPRTEWLYNTTMIGAAARSDQARRDLLAVIRGAKAIPAVVQIDQDHWRKPLEHLSELGLGLFRTRDLAGEIRDRSAELPPFDLELVLERKAPTTQRERKPMTLTQQAAAVPTTLSRISPIVAFRVLLHGYLSTWRVMETTYGPKPMKPMSITRFTEIAGVRNLKVTWQEVEGRKTLKLDFTEDAAGIPQQLEPMPGSNEAALSPAYKKAGLLPPDIWNNARLGHPKAMLACGFLMLGEREFDAAADWFLMAANAGEKEGTKFVAILFREHGYRPSSSAGEEQIRAWNSWNKVVEQLMQLEPETLEAMARVLELPPEARKQATNAHPSFWPDQGNEDFTLECVRAALARIQAVSGSANRKER